MNTILQSNQPRRVSVRFAQAPEFPIRIRRRRWGQRQAVTLMEVILAIAIILAGLVGITALVPVAARNAQATMELDRSVSESTSAAAAGAVRSFTDLDRLVIWDKHVHGSTYAGSYVPTNTLQTIDWKITGQGNNHPPIGSDSFSTAPVVPIGKLETPGYDHMPLGSGLTSGICIDPFGVPAISLATGYVSSPASATPFNGVDNTDSAFNHSRFPYYSERYNPLAAPNDQIGNPPASPSWPMSPRMWRATLKSPMYANKVSPTRSNQLLSAAAVGSVFRGSGGLSPFSGSTDDAPRSMLVTRTNLGGSIVDSARDSASEYTWFATLAPPYLGGNSFRQSIVVVRQRIPAVPTRLNDPLALQKSSYTIDDAEDNPTAERLTWIDPTTAIGFIGGAGGEVMMYGSQSIADDVVTGEWVMLSRQPHFDNGGTWEPTGPAVHRWFRVVRVDEPETDDAFTLTGDSNGPYAVWRRRVTLAGPDWAFQDGAVDGGGTPVAADDTFCTIVRGAVSVIESEVQIQ